jgi:hypothetical protein
MILGLLLGMVAIVQLCSPIAKYRRPLTEVIQKIVMLSSFGFSFLSIFFV